MIRAAAGLIAGGRRGVCVAALCGACRSGASLLVCVCDLFYNFS